MSNRGLAHRVPGCNENTAEAEVGSRSDRWILILERFDQCKITARGFVSAATDICDGSPADGRVRIFQCFNEDWNETSSYLGCVLEKVWLLKDLERAEAHVFVAVLQCLDQRGNSRRANDPERLKSVPRVID